MLRRLMAALGVVAILLLAVPVAGDGASAGTHGASSPAPLGQQASPEQQLVEKSPRC